MRDEILVRDIVAGLPLLEALGFALALDWDDELSVAPPPELDPESIAQLVRNADATDGAPVTTAVRRSAEWARAVFHGGTLRGRPTRHHASAYHVLPDLRRYHLHHVGRAQWEAYVIWHDGRGFLVATATSKAKAMQKLMEATRGK